MAHLKETLTTNGFRKMMEQDCGTKLYLRTGATQTHKVARDFRLLTTLLTIQVLWGITLCCCVKSSQRYTDRSVIVRDTKSKKSARTA